MHCLSNWNPNQTSNAGPHGFALNVWGVSWGPLAQSFPNTFNLSGASGIYFFVSHLIVYFIKSPKFASLGSGEVTWHQLQKKNSWFNNVTSIIIGPTVAYKKKVKVHLEQHRVSFEPQANVEQCIWIGFWPLVSKTWSPVGLRRSGSSPPCGRWTWALWRSLRRRGGRPCYLFFAFRAGTTLAGYLNTVLFSISTIHNSRALASNIKQREMEPRGQRAIPAVTVKGAFLVFLLFNIFHSSWIKHTLKFTKQVPLLGVQRACI